MSVKQKRIAVMLLRWLSGFVALAMPIIILQVFSHTYVKNQPDIPRLAAWITSLLGIGGLFLQAGFEIKDRALGVLVDERNKYSLSRLQMTLWSVLVLGTLYVVFITNIIRSTVVKDALNVNLDWNLIVLMGISVASFITSPIALSRKTANIADDAEVASAGRELADQQTLASTPGATGTVVVKQDPQDARIADLIRGEEVGNATVVDISRVQLLIITIVVVIAYGFSIWTQLAYAPGPLIDLPELHQTLLGLILVSHASYIGGKLTPTTRGTAGANAAESLARALQVSQRATNLVRDLQTSLAAVQSASQAKSLNDALMLARGAAAQAAALPTRVTATDFKVAELFALEGRVDALVASFGSASGAPPRDDIANAPAEQKVAEVQRRLRERGHDDVIVSGIPDAAMEQAIRTELTALGVDRKDLHPRPFRYYEEVAALLA
ncbi:MAG: hypothetical protein WDO56_05985 [Gammaproteobacteria bacterium]